MTGARRALSFVALLALAAALVPVFQLNILAPGDTFFFSNWDARSQSLVLGKIEQDQTGAGSSPFGLVAATPDPMSVYATFDGLASGGGSGESVDGYSQYASSLGLQGHAFEAAYRLGCSTVGCLNTLESSIFSVVFVLFGVLLAVAVRRSVGLVFVFCSLLSPWVVSAAHNLYWVPWTWLLPACAAACSVIARRPGWRAAWLVAVGVATAIKSTTGYEFLTATTLLAASIPVLALLIGQRIDRRRAVATAVWIVIASITGFSVILVVHVIVAGGGSISSGLHFVVWDALRRTQGSPGLDTDPLVNASLRASVFAVLARYIVGWTTPLFSIGVGQPFPAVTLGPGAFWTLLVCVGGVIAVELARRPHLGRRHALIAAVSASPPLSWLIIAKSHSFAETNETYLLWYFIFVPMLVWVVGDAIGDSLGVRRLRRTHPSPRQPIAGTEP